LGSSGSKRMRKNNLRNITSAGLLSLALVLSGLAACGGESPATTTTTRPPITTATTVTIPPVVNYTYRVVNTFPHDRAAFTQGLVYADGVFYESTGLLVRSSLRRVEPATGKVLQNLDLAPQYFAEGLVLWQDSLIQLTWQSGIGFVYDKTTFEKKRDFSYTTEGWGLTQDGRRLIMSDGTANLYFIDPVTFQRTGQVEVRDNGIPVVRLNELEYIDGKVYANIWQTNKIAIIEPDSGRVTGWIDLTGLLPAAQSAGADVLNGIAYDAVGKRLFVTGKLWPLLFEIELIPKN
jgi:glutamine cyclotransferase